MTLLTNNDSKLVQTIITDFSDAWNNKDLARLSGFISDDIVYKNPPIKIGFFSLKGREVYGRFNLLTFWKKFFSRFETINEEKVVLDIRYTGSSYIVTCDIHNYNFDISSRTIFCLNENFRINQIEFKNVKKLKQDKEISVITVLLNQIKKKILN